MLMIKSHRCVSGNHWDLLFVLTHKMQSLKSQSVLKMLKKCVLFSPKFELLLGRSCFYSWHYQMNVQLTNTLEGYSNVHRM